MEKKYNCQRCDGQVIAAVDSTSFLLFGYCRKCGSLYGISPTKSDPYRPSKYPISLEVACPECKRHSMLKAVDPETFIPILKCFFCKKTMTFDEFEKYV